jgi:VIT1/CCC1 family predicted Fe2+/Mn2+ transporter
VAGADPGAGVVRLAGLAGLIAGAVSMAAGEYVSMKAQNELLERELDIERRELRRNPNVETVELAQIYQSRGVDPDRARELAQEMMRDPDLALQTHAREELGIDPDQLGSPQGAAVSSFLSFALGALIPLLPWFFGSGTAAVVASVVLGLAACAVVGALLARFTGRSVLFSAGRQVLIATIAGAVTFFVGNLVGVGV